MMLSPKNQISKLLQENLFLNPEQREQLRAGIEDEKFLEEKGAKVIEMLRAANGQEALIIIEILKRNPNFFRNIEQEKLKSNLQEKISDESVTQKQEASMLEDFLEKEFSNLEL